MDRSAQSGGADDWGMRQHRPLTTLFPEGKGSRGPALHSSNLSILSLSLKAQVQCAITRDTSGAAATSVREMPNEERRCLFLGFEDRPRHGERSWRARTGPVPKIGYPETASSHYLFPYKAVAVSGSARLSITAMQAALPHACRARCRAGAAVSGAPRRCRHRRRRAQRDVARVLAKARRGAGRR